MAKFACSDCECQKAIQMGSEHGVAACQWEMLLQKHALGECT